MFDVSIFYGIFFDLVIFSHSMSTLHVRLTNIRICNFNSFDHFSVFLFIYFFFGGGAQIGAFNGVCEIIKNDLDFNCLNVDMIYDRTLRYHLIHEADLT